MKNPIDKLRSKLEDGKSILIYGAGSQGRGLLRSLHRYGIEIAGFIDKNPSVVGQTISRTTVFPLSILEKKDSSKNYIIIVATYFFEREVSALLESHGFMNNQGYFLYSSLKPHDYVVEISGVCNLCCISCPRATRYPSGRNATMMNLDTFKKVVSKIRCESPFVGNIQLYQWGEPTLNKELPHMIRYARDYGILSTISSNLNYNADFQNIINAKPECFRISASGTGKSYEITHTGGNWTTFIKNVRIISQLRQELYPEMKIEFYFHRYKHGIGEQEKELNILCKDLNLEFHPVPAYIISLDDVLSYCEGNKLSRPTQRARDLLLVDIDEGIQLSKKEKSLDCDVLRVTMINADLSVSTCMMFYDPAINTVADNYLNTPLEEIIVRRFKSPLCHRCRKYGLHRYCSIYAKLGEDGRY